MISNSKHFLHKLHFACPRLLLRDRRNCLFAFASSSIRKDHNQQAFNAAKQFEDEEAGGRKQKFYSQQTSRNRELLKLGAITAGGALLFGVYNNSQAEDSSLRFPFFKTAILQQEHRPADSSGNQEEDASLKPPERKDLPIISLEEVAKHGKNSERVWVTYKQGIYDITEFAESHPGGDKIMLAAGGSIEPFWLIYAQHKTEEVMEILEELRIGSLSASDLQRASQQQMLSEDDPFRADPSRHPALLVNSQKPFNAETPSSLLVDNFITPNELFFVRNHMPVPHTSEETHRLEVSGIGIDKKTGAINLDIKYLRENFEPVKVVSTIQCAGNRRNDMNNFKKVQGLMWTGTAISNAEWTGCRLRDVLLSAGVKPDDNKIKHVQFEGADMDSTGKCYGASVPFEKAMSPEVIIAYEMNGRPLPRDHGFPLRVIAPGIVGARQVKWLTAIRTSEEESESHWQRKDYKAFSSSVQFGDQLPFDSTPAIQEYPVQSAICVPSPKAKIPRGAKTIDVSGYAWSGGGRGIIRVEVSPDNGKTWKCAELEQCAAQDLEHSYAWTLWTIELPITDEVQQKGHLELVCKATDRAYNTQPESSSGIWNVRGLLQNAWHRVEVLLEM